MRVAIYSPYCQKLYGLLHLAPRGVVPEPLGLGQEKDEAAWQLEQVLKHWRMPGHDDATFLKTLPKLLRGRAILLEDGETPSPGFDDLPDDPEDDAT